MYAWMYVHMYVECVRHRKSGRGRVETRVEGGREGNERREGTKGEREIEDLGKKLASFSLTQTLLRLGCCVFRPLFGQIKLLLNPFQSGRVPLKEDGERGRGRKRVRGKG